MKLPCYVFALGVVVQSLGAAGSGESVVVGSKKFTESVVLGEILVGMGRATGIPLEHRRELGGTRVLWSALVRGDIDAYAEYTGTIREEILGDESSRGEGEIHRLLSDRGVKISGSLGFNNTYALGMMKARAEQLSIRRISDLKGHPQLLLGFTSEFMDRKDGWPRLQKQYGLTHRDVRGLDHDVAYRALAQGALDVTDLYSTDAEIAEYGLRILEDDRRVFPDYQAVILFRGDLEIRAPELLSEWRRLEGKIRAEDMIELNREVKLGGHPEGAVAAGFLAQNLGIQSHVEQEGFATRLGRTTWAHLKLVGISLAAALVVAIPLGVLAERRQRLGAWMLGAAGVVQTLPALALLVVTIPLLGIGARPAIVALFLYSLLPILRNTHAGIRGIAPGLRESAIVLGLTWRARLLAVELPLAAPAIMAGIKTAAVINVGTATLGALVGAGGYGQPILTGIRLDDAGLILEGAMPAALLALGVQGLFDMLERRLVPRGLRPQDPGPEPSG